MAAAAPNTRRDFTDMAPGLNVRTRVHEYGGGAYAVSDGVIVFSEFDDNRLLLKRSPGASRQELVTDPALRFADMAIDAARDRVIAVVEDQRESAIEARNLLAAVSLADGVDQRAGHRPRLLLRSASEPRWSRPRLADLGLPADALGRHRPVGRAASGRTARSVSRSTSPAAPAESVMQPKWAPDGSLLYVSDRSDWWNLYRWRAGAPGSAAVAPMEAEIGGPAVGLRPVRLRHRRRRHHLRLRQRPGWLAAAGPRARARLPGRSSFDATGLAYVRVREGVTHRHRRQPPRGRPRCVRLDLAPAAPRSGCARPARSTVDAAYLSVPELHRVPDLGGRTAYAWYYPPTEPRCRGARGRAAPAGGDVARRPDQPGADLAEPREAGVHQPRLRRGGRRLRRLHRLRPRLPRPAARDAGAMVDVDDCTAAATWLAEQGLRRPRASGHPRRQRRRLHHARDAVLQGCLLGGHLVLRPGRPRGLHRHHPQVRIALHGHTSWGPTPRRPSATGSARPTTTRTGSPARCW